MNNEQIDWPADLVTYSERTAYLRGLQAKTSVSSDRAAVDEPVAAGADPAPSTFERALLSWCYTKLHYRSFDSMDDALMLDRIKLFLEHGIES